MPDFVKAAPNLLEEGQHWEKATVPADTSMRQALVESPGAFRTFPTTSYQGAAFCIDGVGR